MKTFKALAFLTVAVLISTACGNYIHSVEIGECNITTLNSRRIDYTYGRFPQLQECQQYTLQNKIDYSWIDVFVER